LIKIGRFSFKTEAEFFQYSMERYFRKVPPVPTNIYLNQSEALKVEHRIKLAKICHFPSIINTLYRDENAQVRKAVEKNDFWILIGKIQDVLGFDKKERKQFARSEFNKILIVIMMFEDDIEILSEALMNPSISIKMITIYKKLLEKRGKGKKDEQILAEAKKILKEKKSRIIKAAEINRAFKNLQIKQNVDLLIHYLSNEDKVVRKAVTNILTDADPHFVLKISTDIIEGNTVKSELDQYICLSEVLSVVRKRENLKRASIKKLNLTDKQLEGKRYHSIADYFYQVLSRKKRMLIKSCVEDLTNFDKIVLLSLGHCDTEIEVRQLASSILTLKDLFSLAQDISTPQHLFKKILNILDEHPDEHVHQNVIKIHEEESKRLWNRLKELETILQAYFDVIFQSLGFVDINQYISAVKSIQQTEKYLQNFWYKFSPQLQKKLTSTDPTFKQVKKTFTNAVTIIEADVSPSKMMELEHVQNMIEQIIELRNFDIEGLRQGAAESLDEELLRKARRIWQSALSQYLGRIKSLNEMLKIKFRTLAPDVIDKTILLNKDFLEVFNEIEEIHKTKVMCSLPHACQVCNRRGCAAERFLTEVHFLLQELLDNFVEE
jgi:hypothetical protein